MRGEGEKEAWPNDPIRKAKNKEMNKQGKKMKGERTWMIKMVTKMMDVGDNTERETVERKVRKIAKILGKWSEQIWKVTHREGGSKRRRSKRPYEQMDRCNPIFPGPCQLNLRICPSQFVYLSY